jgi:hypothetical protein
LKLFFNQLDLQGKSANKTNGQMLTNQKEKRRYRRDFYLDLWQKKRGTLSPFSFYPSISHPITLQPFFSLSSDPRNVLDFLQSAQKLEFIEEKKMQIERKRESRCSENFSAQEYFIPRT